MGKLKPISGLMAAIMLSALLFSCKDEPPAPTPAEMSPVTAQPSEVPDRKLRDMAELYGVKVKLRKNKDGTYSYEITGESVEGVIRADRELRDYTDGHEGDN